MAEPSSARRLAVVTGARRGIGRAIAWQLALAGFDLLLNDLIEDAASNETVQGIRKRGARVEFLRGDIADLATHQELACAAYSNFGRLDVLVNNAGMQVRTRGDLLDVTPERFDEIMSVNLRGTFFLTQCIARHMLEDGQPGTGRAIVTLTSANAELVSVEKGEYCVSKSGLSMATRLFAVRLADAGIPVFEVRPGLIRTDMTAEVLDRYGPLIEQGLSPIRRWGRPEDIGQAVATLVSGLVPFATGMAVDIDGGLLIPRL